MDQKKWFTDGNISIKSTRMNNNVIPDFLKSSLKYIPVISIPTRKDSKKWKQTNQSTSHSPDPLTGHISGTDPMAQHWPDSQQHCLFVNLPGSSCAQRPLTMLEKHVLVL